MCSDLNHTALWSESWIRSPKMPRFGTLESIIMAPTGLLGVGLWGRRFFAHDRIPWPNRVLRKILAQHAI